MTPFFTEEEKKWIVVDLSKEYTITYKEDTPPQIKKSIIKKIENDKKWLRETFGHDVE